ncbi:GTP-binding protein TypA/BipA [hydrothermal vent metagenome]|uniref:GTP-binding protein TypA/BipA n=1 Tax=hydrothermal vent metagenome TaxID=652676 RepID=A0A3B0WDL4_9ZZZZ
MSAKIRNIAIIAHVDHGKTTLVDKLLEQSGTLDERKAPGERIMDSNDQEKERGITITSKNTAIEWNDYHINIVDTPGHADFGGEVERVLSMVDSVLLLVDAVDGPMPQTRFVTQKAFAMGFTPVVVINKIDREGADPHRALDLTFDLFDKLGATDEQLDFPVVYASAINGYAGLDVEGLTSGDMTPLFEAIIEHVPTPEVDPEGTFQLQISTLDYNSYVGIIGIGRIARGSVKTNMAVKIIGDDGKERGGRIGQVLGFHGLERVETDEAFAGDIVAITGIDPLSISDTICDPNVVEALAPMTVDEPTISMTFQANSSPFSGQEGKYVTSRNIWDRLQQELKHNVALRVEQVEGDKYKVSGRGELHLSVLIETMRRENFELAVGRPEVIVHEEDGVMVEPYEELTADIEIEHQGAVMEALGIRKADLKDMVQDGKGRVRLDFIIPARGLIGFRTEYLSMTRGTGLLYSVFDHYGPAVKDDIGQRPNGVLVSNARGKAVAYSLCPLQERGKLLVGNAEEIYEGQIVGIHSRDNDLVVNPIKPKPLTNVRASGTDEALTLSPHIQYTLEQALEFIDDDELVEVTPENIRIRKKILTESARKSSGRGKKK